MEKLPHEEYRDDLAEKLKYIRNSGLQNPEAAKSKATGYLEARKETREYTEVKEEHVRDEIKEVLAKKKDFLKEGKREGYEKLDMKVIDFPKYSKHNANVSYVLHAFSHGEESKEYGERGYSIADPDYIRWLIASSSSKLEQLKDGNNYIVSSLHFPGSGLAPLGEFMGGSKRAYMMFSFKKGRANFEGLGVDTNEEGFDDDTKEWEATYRIVLVKEKEV